MKRVLFIDRDGTLIKEVPPTYQIDSLDKIEFYPRVFTWLTRIAAELDFELVMVTNQDGLGTESFPEDTFWSAQNFIVRAFENEGVFFKEYHIDRSFPHENAPTRKPGIGMLTKYFTADYDLANSFVIGDRITDVQLAKNLGAKAIWMNEGTGLGGAEVSADAKALESVIALESTDWEKIYEFLKLGLRKVSHTRTTKETDIHIELNLDGTGKADIETGLGFFDHMLDQIARHGSIDLTIKAKGDLHIDEHHTIEDVGIALGEAVAQGLGDKRGIERYGYCLPMDDCLAQAAIDFGGRNWIVWDAKFNREKIGEMPTEMFFHFFKSFSDASKSNLNIKAEGENEHHKIEAIFKVFAKAIKMAVKRNPSNMQLPSTKGLL
ncbi:bifunctional histidinol-phosphatase/imidazoleglycerol-phosphate dehydratase HisB [[Flexibacter] sp. ATCC 35208]|uniref:bifunctional histidinol-phosphatase/imidazoleglycerol-phosphate dehydratase HisB n=1 Tax=[Flexibacter] sp. ATCC 35208 TaxID=1936242 RepID=UPI0009C5D499|nr:bifunctional histidinol-phosphatase/imidazoleglycerol-phosphate dehydratase HisB [[Flexibacter] sp. ATCC 35208]OMP80382.1 bifunctional imidazole glycerol-phosphate dehydratase/histidinol phosphatase [[Flexibacter] sp. ATCC 35208]